MGRIIDSIMPETAPGLVKALELNWRRNEALVSNVANAETPQYRAVDLNFAGELNRAFGQSNAQLAITNPKHMDLGTSSGAHLVDDLSGMTKADGNNVDLEVQMGRIAHVNGRYTMATSILRKQLLILRTAIRQP